MSDELLTIEPTEATQPTARLYPLRDLVAEAATVAEALHDARRTGRPIGPVTGLPTLDRELCGALAPGLHILHGQPGAGKTAWLLQAACTCQCPALFVTGEMAPVELLRRIAARVTGEYLNRFKTGEHPPDKARDLFSRAAASAPLLSILDATVAPVRPAELLDFAQAARAAAPGSPHMLIAVDSVHAWSRGWQEAATEYDALNAGLSALRELAQRLGAAVIGSGERNRASQAGGLSATAGTRLFEYGSETLLSLNRDQDATTTPTGETPVVLKIEKNRHGAPGRVVRLLFHGALQRFTEDHIQ